MQNTDNTNNENLNPNGFLNNDTNETIESQQSGRTQNFSFASTYQPSSHLTIYNSTSLETTTKFNSSLPLSSLRLSKPISSFRILSTDDLLTNNNNTNNYNTNSKPNAVVRPIRRYEEGLTLSRSGQQQTNDTDSSDSQSQAHQYRNSNATVTQQQLQQQQQQQQQSQYRFQTLSILNERSEAHNFAEELDRKLRYLHSHRDGQATWADYRRTTQDVGKRVKGKDNYIHTSTLSQRPLFYTTVPTGIFLPPPKEIPLPAFLRPYVYSSHPMVLSNNQSNNNNNNSNNIINGGSSTIGGSTYGGAGIYNTNFNKSSIDSKDKLHSSTAPIDVADKSYVATTTTATASTLSSRFSGPGTAGVVGSGFAGGGGGGNGTGVAGTQYSQQLASGVHLTKQQFLQQVQQSRAKREMTSEPYKNVMHDRRVIRGSNFAKKKVPSDYESDEPSADLRRQQMFRKKNLARYAFKRQTDTETETHSGRRDEVIQTDSELEDVRNNQLTNDRRKFDRLSSKVDVATEITENELFMRNDDEARNLIDMFVDICVEECVLEIEHEIQMDAIHKKRKELEALRQAEMDELKRMEREKIISVYTNAAPKEQGTTAAKLLQNHIANLVPEVLENMEPVNEPAKKEELINTIYPWLTVEVAEEVGQIVDSREILTVIIEEIIRQRAEIYGGYKLEIQAEEIEPPKSTASTQDHVGK